MVYEVSPTYYAHGLAHRVFSVTGAGFSILPADAIGILSGDNNNPLMYRDDEREFTFGNVVVVNDATITIDTGEHSFSGDVYLGAILSGDRTNVYWENTTRPLP